MRHETSHRELRPWGCFQVLDESPDHKVKRIVLQPGKRHSLQRHAGRSEHWFIVSGEAVVTLDGVDITVVAGSAVDIPCGSLHRMTNTGDVDVMLIEVQTGDYFDEDDIERFEDDYGRV